jgi:hypothetical protein
VSFASAIGVLRNPEGTEARGMPARCGPMIMFGV